MLTTWNHRTVDLPRCSRHCLKEPTTCLNNAGDPSQGSEPPLEATCRLRSNLRTLRLQMINERSPRTLALTLGSFYFKVARSPWWCQTAGALDSGCSLGEQPGVNFGEGICRGRSKQVKSTVGDLSFQLKIPMRGHWDMRGMATSLMCRACYVWVLEPDLLRRKTRNDESQGRGGLVRRSLVSWRRRLEVRSRGENLGQLSVSAFDLCSPAPGPGWAGSAPFCSPRIWLPFGSLSVPDVRFHKPLSRPCERPFT